MNTSSPVVEMSAVTKSYGGLRPLRIKALAVAPRERVAIAGIDAPGAEVMVNLVTGASLPDEGEVRVFGVRTRDLADGDEWLSSLDRYGIVTDRAVMLEGSTLVQNLALPFTLEIDPVSPETRNRVAQLAEECDIEPAWLDQPVVTLPAAVRARTHLARALALGPALLVMEHPSGTLPAGERRKFGEMVQRICDARALTTLMISMDAEFSGAAAHRVLTLEPGTGTLKAQSRRGWFGF
jgi:ABC-type transporter Mla maintaining outer membrane lipid asymmetry ATPase subunit MlaF